MTEKELRKMSRRQLLEMLMLQTRRNEELENKLVDSERRAAELRRQLNERQLALSDAGTLAEAALRLNGVFAAADAAAKQYLENVQSCDSRCQQLLEATQKRCDEMERRAEEKVRALKAELARISRELGGGEDEGV